MGTLVANGGSGKDDCLFMPACCRGACLNTEVPVVGICLAIFGCCSGACFVGPTICTVGGVTGAGSDITGFSRVACLTGVGSRTICLTGVGSFKGISFTGIGENIIGGSFCGGSLGIGFINGTCLIDDKSLSCCGFIGDGSLLRTC